MCLTYVAVAVSSFGRIQHITSHRIFACTLESVELVIVSVLSRLDCAFNLKVIDAAAW